ncbi:MAG: hydroxymethylglutaryl-CoA lyase [Flavobacteriales bacterium]|mgnify:CR=1 FL=1|nr:hydroxymethylglutaryl-CoA lyase [Flavobacteriales bacterium]
MESRKIKIVECPRDAMQGLQQYIPAEKKAHYINSLLQVGFDIVDVGSFVSVKAVPQMRDTSDVIRLLKLQDNTKLLSVVLNQRGALDASGFEEISILGYPLSISEVFQKNNSNKNIQDSLLVLDEIHNICIRKNKTLLVYLSMAFGNPYGEIWNEEVVLHYIEKICNQGIALVSLADTMGSATTESIKYIYSSVKEHFSSLDVGIHLHASPKETYSKIESAWNSGCNRFDVTIGGYGGCPFASDKLVGNIATEKMLNFLADNKIEHQLDLFAFENACNQAKNIFNNYNS